MNTAHRGFSAYLHELITVHQSTDSMISKSYSGRAMAICVSDKRKISVDIEEKGARADETIRFFKKKFRTFGIATESTDLEWFYRTWTAMESYLKFTGYGFKAPKDFIVDLDANIISMGDRPAAHLKFIFLPHFVLCLCCEQALKSSDPEISCFGWEDA